MPYLGANQLSEACGAAPQQAVLPRPSAVFAGFVHSAVCEGCLKVVAISTHGHCAFSHIPNTWNLLRPQRADQPVRHLSSGKRSFLGPGRAHRLDLGRRQHCSHAAIRLHQSKLNVQTRHAVATKLLGGTGGGA